MSLLEFYYCSCDGPHRCHSYPIFVLFVAILSVSHVQLYVTCACQTVPLQGLSTVS